MSGYIGFMHAPIGPSEWGVTFLDVPGCVSAGETFEAAEAAREALSGHLALLTTEGLELPPARTLAELRADASIAEDLAESLVPLIAPRRVPGERARTS